MPISWRETIVDSSNVSSWNYEYPSMITHVNSKRNLFMLWTGVSDTSGCDKILRYGLINDAAGDPSGTDMDPSCVIRTPRENSWNSDIGQYTSMEIDGSAVFITFTDWTIGDNEQLYFGYTPDGTKTDLSGGSWTFSAVEDDLKVEHVSLSIVNHKTAHISYNDVNDEKLKYAICEDVTVEAPEWTKSNVTFEGNNVTGQYSNVFGDDSNAFIGWTSNEPKVHFTYTNDPNPASGTINWTTSVVSDGGEYLSMAMNSIGIKAGHKQYQAFLSYRKDSKLYYICNTDVLNNEIWDISGEVHADDPSDISIAISQRNPSDDNPRAYIAYKTNDELKFVYTDNATTEPLGGTWTSSDISGTEYSSNCSLAVTGRNVYVTHFNARTYGGSTPTWAGYYWPGSGSNSYSDGGGPICSFPPGLNPGDTFQWLFVTSNATNGGGTGFPGSSGNGIPATNSDINYYDEYVNYVWQADVSGASSPPGQTPGIKTNLEDFFGPICWKAIVSTPTVNAIDHIDHGTEPNFKGVWRLDCSAGQAPTGTQAKLADTTSELFGPLYYKPGTTESAFRNWYGGLQWTGTKADGTKDTPYEVGNTGDQVRVGNCGSTAYSWVYYQTNTKTAYRGCYALSEVLRLPPVNPYNGELIISCWKVPVLETLQAGNF